MPSVQLTRDYTLTIDENFSVILPARYTVNLDALGGFLENYKKGIIKDVWLNPFFKVSIVGKEFQLHGYQVYPRTWLLSEMSNDMYFIPFRMEENVVVDSLSLFHHMLVTV
jgi:hypothetical protein